MPERIADDAENNDGADAETAPAAHREAEPPPPPPPVAAAIFNVVALRQVVEPHYSSPVAPARFSPTAGLKSINSNRVLRQ